MRRSKGTTKAWAAAADATSLDPAPGILASEAVERAKWIETASRPSTSDDDALVTAIISGELTSQEAAVQSITATGDAARRLSERAADRILGAALEELRAMGDLLITDYLRPVSDELVAEIMKLAPMVEGIATDEDSVKGGPKAAAA